MQIIEPTYRLIKDPNFNVLDYLELCGRTAYRSQPTADSAANFVRSLIFNKHDSVLEHISLGVEIITDRAVANELTRHRLASFTQESTRYVSYKDELTVICPANIKEGTEEHKIWVTGILAAERCYQDLLFKASIRPQDARSVLPLCTATSLILTANLREFRHIFQLRCSPKAHPDMRRLMIPMLEEFKQLIPVVFDDIFPH